ncbi:MAG: hypothetical protein LUD76_07610 [Alistipes sp.]|nr:hypothetical protein [Alistipes sp.]
MAAVAAMGCSRDGEPSAGAGGGSTAEVAFTAGYPAHTLATRSGGGVIAELDLLVFRVDGTGEVFEQRTTVNSFTVDDGEVKFRVKLVMGDQSRRFVLLANSSAALDALGTLSGTETKDDLLGRLTDGRDGVWDPASTIPMWGETVNTYVISQAQARVSEPISLLRMAARIDLAVSGAVGAEVFDLTAVYLYNANTRGAIVPLPANRDGTLPLVTAPTIPLGTTTAASPFEYSVPAGDNSCTEIYTYEKQYSADPAGALYLVLEGYYKGSDRKSYYRVDVLREVDGKAPAGLLRNHLYRLTVTSVDSPGAATAAEALISDDAQVTVRYEVWDECDLALYFDGENMLVISQPGWTVSRTAGSMAVSVYTDCEGGWTAGVTAGAVWLSIDGPAAGPAGTRSDLAFTVTANDSGASRTGTVTVTAGGFTGEVTVTQTAGEALSVAVVDAAGDPVDELLFAAWPGSLSSAPQQFTVEWTPASALCIVQAGAGEFAYGDDSDTPGDSEPANGGSRTYTVRPVPFTATEVAGNSYLERVLPLRFYVVHEGETVACSLALRQIYSH